MTTKEFLTKFPGTILSSESRLKNGRKPFSKETKSKRLIKIRENFGVDNVSQLPKFKEKQKETWRNKTEKEIEEIVKKREKTNLNRYGVTNCYNKDLNTEKKSTKARKAYGTRKEFLLQNFGVENNFQLPEVIKKIKIVLEPLFHLNTFW